MKKEYVYKIHIKNNSFIKYNECIDYYLFYAFGKYTKTHTIRYYYYSKLYLFFDELESIIPVKEKITYKG